MLAPFRDRVLIMPLIIFSCKLSRTILPNFNKIFSMEYLQFQLILLKEQN